MFGRAENREVPGWCELWQAEPRRPARSRAWSPLGPRPRRRDMAQFVFESDLHALLQLDAPIPNAPIARWQRKAKEATGPAPSPMRAANRSHSAGRTPSRTPGEWVAGGGRWNRLRVGLHAPSRSLVRLADFSLPAPGKSNSKVQTTPTKPGGDRYIPQRSASQMEVASFLLSKENQPEDGGTPTKKV